MLIATGFLALGVKDVNQRFKVRFVMDNVDEQIDAVSRSVLALTVELCPLPRPQVRPDPDHRLLRPGRHLPAAPTSARRCATRWAAAGWTTTTRACSCGLGTERPAPHSSNIARREGHAACKKELGRDPRHAGRAAAKGPNGLPKQRQIATEDERLQAELLA